MRRQWAFLMIAGSGAGLWLGACSNDGETDSGMGGAGGSAGETGSGGATGGADGAGGNETSGGNSGLGGGGAGGEGGGSDTGGSDPGSGGDTSSGGDTGTGGSVQTCSGTLALLCNAQEGQTACAAVGCNWNPNPGNCSGQRDVTDCADIDVSACAEVTGCSLN